MFSPFQILFLLRGYVLYMTEDFHSCLTLSLSYIYIHSSLISPIRSTRRIQKAPYKVLDAPCLQDDFYLHLLDWSSSNIVAVGLGNSVFLWNACTSSVSKLTSMKDVHISSVSWNPDGNRIAVGSARGRVCFSSLLC